MVCFRDGGVEVIQVTIDTPDAPGALVGRGPTRADTELEWITAQAARAKAAVHNGSPAPGAVS